MSSGSCRCLYLVVLALLVLALAVPTLAAEAAADESVRINDDLEIRPLAEGVWLHTSWMVLEKWGRVAANGLVVVSGRKAALVDTPWNDEQTRALMLWVAENTGARVTTVVATHAHIDCDGGLAAAHAAGAESYSLARSAEIRREQRKTFAKQGFDDELTIELGKRRLTLRYHGAGHTVDNIVVWIPDAKLLFGGCLVRSAAAKALGNVAEADLEAWPVTAEELLYTYVDAQIVVPGHGAPGGRELLERTLELAEAAKP